MGNSKNGRILRVRHNRDSLKVMSCCQILFALITVAKLVLVMCYDLIGCSLWFHPISELTKPYRSVWLQPGDVNIDKSIMDEYSIFSLCTQLLLFFLHSHHNIHQIQSFKSKHNKLLHMLKRFTADYWLGVCCPNLQMCMLVIPMRSLAFPHSATQYSSLSHPRIHSGEWI